MIRRPNALRRAPLLALAASLISHAATPKAWFKADSLALEQDAAVSLWPDSSRNGHVALAGSSAPTYQASGLAGHPSIRFNGTQSMVFARPVQDDFSVIVLFRSAGGSGSSSNFYSTAGIVSGETPGVTDDFGIGLSDSGRVVAGTGSPDVTIRSPTGYDDDTPHLLTFTRHRETSALRLYLDQELHAESTAAGSQSLNAFPRLTIGAQPGPYNFFHGDIAEIIVFEGTFAPGEVLAAESALRGKYQLPGGTPPIAPANLSANGARLTWDEAIGAETYRVLRADTLSGPFTVVAENLPASAFTDLTLAGGRTAHYQIVAVNPSGASAPSAVATASLPELPDHGRVLINEIHYNGLDNSVHSDFIELYNFSNSPADVGGWRLSSAVDYTFPPATVIPAGGYLVIAQDPATIQALWGVPALGPYAKSLSSDGETIRLRTAANTIVHEVTYRSGFPWPCAANGDGASAELMNPRLDSTLGSSWRSSVAAAGELTGEIASPGAQNFQFLPDPPPNIEEVAHHPAQPASAAPITITARLSSETGVASATLAYQLVTPGAYIPAHLPLPIVNHNIDTSQPQPPNPAFEDPANWTTVPMIDDGTNGDAAAGDGIFTAVIPGQPHRTLVRYRVAAEDGNANLARAPFADDASKNFACFVYDGVPAYQDVPASTLTTLPVYHLLTREEDYQQCVAYDNNDQLTGNTPGWTHKNWEGAFVFEGVVHDHVRYRLHGGNGRYYHRGKRGFRFFFNKGYHFQNRDNDGELLPTRWNSMTTENGWENRGTLTYSLNEIINFHLWRTIGVPAPRSNWGHFRTITTAGEQPDPHHGDFWGLIMLHEDYDSDFLDSHSLEKGNLYKLTRDGVDGPSQLRYQAADAVNDGSDHYNIHANLRADKGEDFIRRYVDVAKWSYYHALCHAVRHYDYWPDGDNNAAWYFAPDHSGQTTDRLGKLWVLPNDVDATWGPTWNEGRDRVHSAIFDPPANPGLHPIYFNAVREVRDLLWQPDQIDPLLDEFAAVIAPFIPADNLRWKGAPDSAGNYNGLGGAGYVSLENLVNDMKKFAWSGGNWPGGGVPSGGTAGVMDQLQLGVDSGEALYLPDTPTITYQGPDGYPLSGLVFSTTAFSDPQGPGDFAAIQWRIAEVTDPSAPAHHPAEKFRLEWNSAYDSGPLPWFSSTFTFPENTCLPGRTYRARVRHQDTTGRWSHWSAPVGFIAGTPPPPLPLVISEMLYKPHNPTPAEISAGFDDQEFFEFLEIRNVGDTPADLSGTRFDEGITFTFPAGFLLAPGASTLVVSNPAAFLLRYGPDRHIAGAYSGNLKNSGERIRYAAPDGSPIVDFTYLDVAPWPTEADTGGHSLVLIHPASMPDPALPENWRASRLPGGAPGFHDDIDFASWAASHGINGSPLDDDAHGVSHALRYALPANAPAPPGVVRTIGGNPTPYLTTTFRRLVDAADITYHVEYSTDLSLWNESAVRTAITPHYDGTATETWRAPLPVSEKGFLRVRIGPP